MTDEDTETRGEFLFSRPLLESPTLASLEYTQAGPFGDSGLIEKSVTRVRDRG
jgi:hypothetical protein